MINFPEQKKTDLRVKTWGGVKDMLSPHVKNGGIHHPPQDLRPCHSRVELSIKDCLDQPLHHS